MQLRYLVRALITMSFLVTLACNGSWSDDVQILGKTKAEVIALSATPLVSKVDSLRSGYEVRFEVSFYLLNPGAGDAEVLILVDGRATPVCEAEVSVVEESETVLLMSCNGRLEQDTEGVVTAEVQIRQDWRSPHSHLEWISVAANIDPSIRSNDDSLVDGHRFCPKSPLLVDFFDEDKNHLITEATFISLESTVDPEPTESVGPRLAFDTPLTPGAYTLALEAEDLGQLKVLQNLSIEVFDNHAPVLPALHIADSPDFAYLNTPYDASDPGGRRLCAAQFDDDSSPVKLNGSDPDDFHGEPVLSYEWYKGSDKEPLLDGEEHACISESDAGVKFGESQSWTLKVSAKDDCGGETSAEAYVTLGNLPPIVEDVAVVWGTALAAPSCARDTSNPDGGEPAETVLWFLADGTLLGEGAEADDALCSLSPGVEVYCEVTATDSPSGAAPQEVTVTSDLASVPSPLPVLSLKPAAVSTEDDIRCEAENVAFTGCISLESSEDLAAEPESSYVYRFEMSRKGGPKIGACPDGISADGICVGSSAIEIDSAATAVGDEWVCKGVVVDRETGEELGSEATLGFAIKPHPVKRLVAGDGFSCLLNVIGQLDCWGGGFSEGGENLGQEGVIDIDAYGDLLCLLMEAPEGEVRCYEPPSVDAPQLEPTPLFVFSVYDLGVLGRVDDSPAPPNSAGDRLWIGVLGGCHQFEVGEVGCWRWPTFVEGSYPMVVPWAWPGEGEGPVIAMDIGGHSAQGLFCAIFEEGDGVECCKMFPDSQALESCFDLEASILGTFASDIKVGSNFAMMLGASGEISHHCLTDSSEDQICTAQAGWTKRYSAIGAGVSSFCAVPEAPDDAGVILCTDGVIESASDLGDILLALPLGLLSVGATHGVVTDNWQLEVMTFGDASNNLWEVPGHY